MESSGEASASWQGADSKALHGEWPTVEKEANRMAPYREAAEARQSVWQPLDSHTMETGQPMLHHLVSQRME